MTDFEKSENRNINIIRYFLCIPAGVLGYYMALLFLYFFSYFNDYMFGDNWMQNYLPDILSHDADQTISLFMGATYFFSLYSIYHVIPEYKRLVGLLLGAIYFFGQALIIYLSFFTLTVGYEQFGVTNLNYVESVSILIGISACIYVIYNRLNLFPK
jgi:hypothetical protein